MKKIFIFGILVLFLISFIVAQGNQSSDLDYTEEDNQSSDLNNSGESNQNDNQTSNQEDNQISAANQNQGELTQAQLRNVIRARNRLRIYAQAEECPENCTCTGSVTKCNLKDGKREMTIRAGKSGNTIVQVKGIDMTTNVTLYHHNGKIYRQVGDNQTKEIKILPDEVQKRIRERTRARLENSNITLDENGTYQIRAQKRARLFFLFPVREKVEAQINSETGEITKIRNPWWGFLARDIAEEDTSEE